MRLASFCLSVKINCSLLDFRCSSAPQSVRKIHRLRLPVLRFCLQHDGGSLYFLIRVPPFQRGRHQEEDGVTECYYSLRSCLCVTVIVSLFLFPPHLHPTTPHSTPSDNKIFQMSVPGSQQTLPIAAHPSLAHRLTAPEHLAFSPR